MKLTLHTVRICALIGLALLGNKSSADARPALQPAWARLTLPNGMTAWHRQLPAARTISIRVCVPSAAGLQPSAPANDRLLFSLLGTAGEEYPRTRLDRIRDEGALEITGTSGQVFSSLSVSAIANRAQEAAKILASLLYKPARDGQLFAELRTRAVNELRWRNGNAWSALDPQLMQRIYGGQVEGQFYGLSDSALAATRLEDVLEHHRTILALAETFLVSCGPLSAREMQAILAQNFTRPRLGPEPYRPLREPFPAATNAVHLFPHQAASSVWVKGVSAAPRPGSPDYPAFVLTARIWSEMLMDSVRSRAGLVYSIWASSPSRQRHASAEFVLYRCQDVPRAITLAEESLRALRAGTAVLPTPDGQVRQQSIDDVLPAMKNQLLASIALQNITPAERTASFAAWLLASGSAAAFDILPEAIRSVTADAIRQTARRYFQAMHWGVTLSPAAVSNAPALRWNP